MEQGAKHRKYSCDKIPVIFFNMDSQAWEAFDKADEKSRMMAKYRNREDELELLILAQPGRGYRSYKDRKEEAARRARAERQRSASDRQKKRFFNTILFGGGFMVIWWIMLNGKF